jgi:hypothetical protein
MDKNDAARQDLAGIREINAFAAGLDQREESRRAVPTLQGCYNKQVRQYSKWFRLLCAHSTHDSRDCTSGEKPSSLIEILCEARSKCFLLFSH